MRHYAPLIVKRGDENDGKQGRDWLTNFDFDRDGDFSNNRLNWRNVDQYVAAAQSGSGAYSGWRIRPTLYTALIEYMDGGSKALVLLYHVYNAADKDGSEIHDWERVEDAAPPPHPVSASNAQPNPIAVEKQPASGARMARRNHAHSMCLPHFIHGGAQRTPRPSLKDLGQRR